MATRRLTVADIGEVTLYKRRGVRSIRLSVDHSGNVRVSLPAWAPYRMGLEFLAQKKDWIREQAKVRPPLVSGTRIGKAHNLIFITANMADKPTSKRKDNEILIRVPPNMAYDDKAVQEVAFRASVRALKAEAENLLPVRLHRLAEEHGFTYSSVRIRHLKSRWGSCDHKQAIVLNCFLMQLPWELIDYVLMHELVHTRILAHGKPFWQELGRHVTNLDEVRKTMRAKQPVFIVNTIAETD